MTLQVCKFTQCIFASVKTPVTGYMSSIVCQLKPDTSAGTFPFTWNFPRNLHFLPVFGAEVQVVKCSSSQMPGFVNIPTFSA